MGLRIIGIQACLDIEVRFEKEGEQNTKDNKHKDDKYG